MKQYENLVTEAINFAKEKHGQNGETEKLVEVNLQKRESVLENQ